MTAPQRHQEHRVYEPLNLNFTSEHQSEIQVLFCNSRTPATPSPAVRIFRALRELVVSAVKSTLRALPLAFATLLLATLHRRL